MPLSLPNQGVDRLQSVRFMFALVLLCIVSADHYKILGVNKGASDREIKRAYHKLALKHHPDKSPACKDSQESAGCKKSNRNFMKISQAYETLSDPEKRRYYDQTGFDSAQQQQQQQQQQHHRQHHGGPFGG
eukprot:CAMPEP_0172163500 /NCGR_PEP_ID=MMETSP1050-20130122/7306_1 /TAXON_ID=233186 /ORGANISM="Cryptomonas curvata, Strain CCAP979/52" /LENGTH=131 /DNA_ID=CAMNT_0012833697 /DNA_START=50 /DNA_END=442 /DNA_ORIENTATION=-